MKICSRLKNDDEEWCATDQIQVANRDSFLVTGNNLVNGKQIDEKSYQWFGATVKTSGEDGIILVSSCFHIELRHLLTTEGDARYSGQFVGPWLDHEIRTHDTENLCDHWKCFQ